MRARGSPAGTGVGGFQHWARPHCRGLCASEGLGGDHPQAGPTGPPRGRITRITGPHSAAPPHRAVRGFSNTRLSHAGHWARSLWDLGFPTCQMGAVLPHLAGFGGRGLKDTPGLRQLQAQGLAHKCSGRHGPVLCGSPRTARGKVSTRGEGPVRATGVVQNLPVSTWTPCTPQRPWLTQGALCTSSALRWRRDHPK